MKIRIFAYCIMDNHYHLVSSVHTDIPVRKTKHGEILGSNVFLKQALQKFNRRKIPKEECWGVNRKEEVVFKPLDSVLWKFEKKHGIKIHGINTGTWEGKGLTGELMVRLRDLTGLKYKEIGGFNIFGDLSFSSLRSLYRISKDRNKGQRQ